MKKPRILPDLTGPGCKVAAIQVRAKEQHVKTFTSKRSVSKVSRILRDQLSHRLSLNLWSRRNPSTWKRDNHGCGGAGNGDTTHLQELSRKLLGVKKTTTERCTRPEKSPSSCLDGPSVWNCGTKVKNARANW